MMRTLNVYSDHKLVGQLFDDNNLWSFQYDQGWLDYPDNHPLSFHIPLQAERITDGSTRRTIQWFFDNLLPEENARELLARDVKITVDDAFELLRIAGAESAGAITLLPPDQVLQPGNVHALDNNDLSQRIRKLPKIPLNRTERKRMSMAGAQHKMLVVLHEDKLFEPSGFFPSTHILKPEHTDPQKYHQTVRNEWFVMRLANACHLNVPDVYTQATSKCLLQSYHSAFRTRHTCEGMWLPFEQV